MDNEELTNEELTTEEHLSVIEDWLSYIEKHTRSIKNYLGFFVLLAVLAMFLSFFSAFL